MAKVKPIVVGILKEIKVAESRVSMTPAGVDQMIRHGHTVLVERNAGLGSGFDDEAYRLAGAEIVETPAEIFARSDMVMHVKEPQPSEYKLIRPGQIVFTYLHLAAEETLTKAMVDSGCVGIAYETVERLDCSLPLLTPMSEVAGRLAAQEAAKYLERPQGGRGILLGGVTGVEPGVVVVIGGGIVGINAAQMACGMGAQVYILDNNLDRLRHLADVMPKNCLMVASSPAKVRELVQKADAVIGAVLVAGAKAPHLITRDMLPLMKKGAVIVDVAIDQGGCCETSHATTHANPTYEVDGVVHYCVANMPGAVPMTSTLALTNATLPYALQLADKGWEQAVRDSREMKLGVNVLEGHLVYRAVAEAFNLPYEDIDELLAKR
jgi:alanine dehydrogenase